MMADAALPPGAPWWATLVLAGIAAVPGIVAVVLAILKHRSAGHDSTAKALDARFAKIEARIAELEDDGTDPDLRAARQQRDEQRVADLEARLAKIERRAEEAARVDLEIQRILGRVEGFMSHHDRRP